jgi:hypothetical protein
MPHFFKEFFIFVKSKTSVVLQWASDTSLLESQRATYLKLKPQIKEPSFKSPGGSTSFGHWKLNKKIVVVS